MRPQSVSIIICLWCRKEAIIVLICAAVPRIPILAEAFKSSTTASRRTRRTEPVHKPFNTAATFFFLLFCRSRSIRYSYFLLSWIERWGVAQTIQSLIAAINFFHLLCGFTGKLQNKVMKGWGKERRKRAANGERVKIFGFVVQRHGYEEEFPNSREGGNYCLNRSEHMHSQSLREGCQSE